MQTSIYKIEKKKVLSPNFDKLLFVLSVLRKGGEVKIASIINVKNGLIYVTDGWVVNLIHNVFDIPDGMYRLLIKEKTYIVIEKEKEQIHDPAIDLLFEDTGEIFKIEEASTDHKYNHTSILMCLIYKNTEQILSYEFLDKLRILNSLEYWVCKNQKNNAVIIYNETHDAVCCAMPLRIS